MYKQSLRFFIFLVCICISCTSFSQITISTSSVGGCIPFNATYLAPTGAVGNWNFGDGGTSNLASGSHNYLNAGTYICTYSGLNGSTPVNFAVTVYAFANPVANFAINQPTNNCAIKTVMFTDQSTSSSTINQWQWVYGDGASNTYTNGNPVTHAYTTPGNYIIALQVTDVNGCSNQVSIGTVSVFAGPVAVIGSSPINLSQCFPPFNVAFNGNGSTTSGATYAWDFGNTQTSTQLNPPSITYTASGLYPVTLTVSANGCSSVISKLVTITSPTLTAIAPPTICLNSPFTVTVTSNQPTTSWNLGNGSTVFVPSSTTPSSFVISATYNSTGVKNITVTAGFGSCLGTATLTTFVDQVTANFSSPPPAFSCASPFIQTYLNTSSSNATQFNWSYTAHQGGTIAATGANPTFSFTQGSLNPYTNYNSIYNPSYAPSVTLVASSAAGCSATVVHKFDSITRPTASFFKSKREGCAPLTVTLTNNSFIYTVSPVSNPISSYTWCNGASPPIFSTGVGAVVPNYTFTYNSTGTYTPYLIIQTAAGCTDVSFIDTIIVSTPPLISFLFSPTGTVCPNQPIQITNTTPTATIAKIDHWHVESDNGFFSGCINDPNPSWNFTHVGVHGFTMSAYVNGCKGTTVSPQSITVKGPIVSGRYETNCTNRLQVNFHSYLQSATTATLNFGDNSPVHIITGNVSANVSTIVPHTYTATGNYTATLSGNNAASGCSNSTYTMLVTVRNIQATVNITSGVTSSSIGCVNIPITFDATSSKDVFSSCSRGYVWYVDAFPPSEDVTATLTQPFTSVGIHTVKLMVKDINSCTSTVTSVVRISSVTPVFTLSPSSVCASGGSISFTNTSTSSAPDNITSSNLDFGDFQSFNLPPLTSTSHTYNNVSPPIVTAILSVTNNVGCVGSAQRTISVITPTANLSVPPPNNNLCIGNSPITVNFDVTSSNTSYTWNFGTTPPTTFITITPTVAFNYTFAGNYNVTVKVKDAQGCEGISNAVTLLIQKTPAADFIFSSPKSNGSNVICSPATVSFTDASAPSQAFNYSWNLGSGSLGLSQPIVTFPYSNANNTIVAISLTVATVPNGCTASVTKNFNLYTPKADIIATKTIICLGDAIGFSIKDTTGRGILAWNWDFGSNNNTDTVLARSSPPSSTLQPFNTYVLPNGDIEVNLIYYSSQYACKDAAKLNIRVIKIDADFKRNNELARIDSIHCINKLDNFFNSSPNSSASSFNWDFGNGATSTLQNPSYTYTQSGVYQVTLTIREPVSTCKGSTVKKMVINSLPTAIISSKDSVCKDFSFDLIGSGTSTAGIIGYQWSPASSVSNSLLAITNATAASSSDFSLVVTDGNGCVSKPTVKNIYIQQPPPSVTWDTTVIVGEPVTMNTDIGIGFAYNWSPNRDINCTNCLYPTSISTVNITYSVEVSDNLGCFKTTNTYSIYIDPQTSVDIPTAFTPNGDGTNDVIYVDGWGIKKLNYFRIYNRWGQLLFESNDVNVGWDGTFNGVPQNMETYVYQVSVETYLDKNGLQKTSSFKLIR